MQIEHYPVEKLKKELKEITAKHFTGIPYTLFFFGSRVAGTHSLQSDIDVGIESPEKLSESALARIREEVARLTILYKIDIVDFSQLSDEFKQVAREYIEPIQ